MSAKVAISCKTETETSKLKSIFTSFVCLKNSVRIFWMGVVVVVVVEGWGSCTDHVIQKVTAKLSFPSVGSAERFPHSKQSTVSLQPLKVVLFKLSYDERISCFLFFFVSRGQTRKMGYNKLHLKKHLTGSICLNLNFWPQSFCINKIWTYVYIVFFSWSPSTIFFPLVLYLYPLFSDLSCGRTGEEYCTTLFVRKLCQLISAVFHLSHTDNNSIKIHFLVITLEFFPGNPGR